MKKSEACKAQVELEAPVRLTPEQLELVAAGFKAQLTTVSFGGKGGLGGLGGIGGATTGAIGPMRPVMKLF